MLLPRLRSSSQISSSGDLQLVVNNSTVGVATLSKQQRTRPPVAMAGRYADLSTEELDRLIDLEERRMGRERAGTRRRQRCAPRPATARRCSPLLARPWAPR